MNATAGLAWNARSQHETDELQIWMESLASGEWTADDFLREVVKLEKHDSGLPWDVLTMLEQYFHRELISHELFICVRARLQKHLEAGDKPARAAEPLVEVQEDPVPGTLRAGDVIRGRYRVTEILDKNAWGTMVEAVDEHRVDVPEVRTRVAVYVYDVLRSGEAELLQRIYGLQSVSHPSIQNVFDVDEHQGQLVVTLEWLSGITVHQLLNLNGGQRLSPAAARTIVQAVAGALSYAHLHDVYHGSIDTRSIVVTENGAIKVRGFLQGLHWETDPKVDRLGFANLAYKLLGGGPLPESHLGPRARKAALRQPPGLSRRQWEVLSNALLGRDSPSLLSEFSGEGDVAASRHTITNALRAEPVRRQTPWLAAGAVAVTLAAVGFVLLGPMTVGTSQASTAMSPGTVVAQKAPVLQTVSSSQPARVAQPPAAPTAQMAEQPPVAFVSVAPRRPSPVAPRPARIELQASTVETPSGEPFARVQVRRRDNLQAPVSFKWWTETGSAQANRDFLGIEPRLEWIPAGAGGVELRVPLLVDPTRTQSRNFYVKIEGAGSSNVVLGSRTLTQVNVPPGAGASTMASLP